MRKYLLLLLLVTAKFSFTQEWKPQNGVNNPKNHYTAFTKATIFVKKGFVLQNATLLVKGQKIIAIGSDVVIPTNTIIHDLEGAFIYPSFIETHADFGMKKESTKNKNFNPQLESKKSGPYYWNESIKPEYSALDNFEYNKEQAEKYRKMGFGAVLSHNMDGVIRGTSTLFSLTDEAEKFVLQPQTAFHYSFYKGSSRQTYPTSLMGMIALIRQSLYDAKWYEQNKDALDYNSSLEAINKHKNLPQILDAGSTQSELRAAKLGEEFGINFTVKGNGMEYKQLTELKNSNVSVIVPVNYPKPYSISNPFDGMQLPLAKMKEWELAPYNISYLKQADIPFVISSTTIKKPEVFLANCTRSINATLSQEDLVFALTEQVAELLKVGDKLGTLEEGKLANFLIVTDSIFNKGATISENWVLGKKFTLSKQAEIDIRGTYNLNIDKKIQFTLKIEGSLNVPKASVADKNSTNFLKANIKLSGNKVQLSFAKDSTNSSFYNLSGNVSDKKSRIWEGKLLLNEKWKNWAAIKNQEFEPKKKVTAPSLDTTLPKMYFPNMAFGWDSIPEAKPIVFRNATIWTNEKDGILKNHDLVVFDGKIQMVGYKINLAVMFPEKLNQFVEIDAKGKHITTGIIDEHSHIAISRGVNEAGQAVSAEVSIQDVVNSEDINIYRQLAGGVTTSQLLHGSANPVGGQSAIIKLRWGKSPKDMLLDSASKFIKFALGENVKQSNWGDRNKVRFPQTRMGVEQVFYDAFYRAKEYKANWDLYHAKSKKEKKESTPPRVDLELETLVEILDTQRFITCHSYIQSEINMLMHVADSMGFKVNTFTHILEGYKVADKMKKHGVAGSTFSDWWAYKFEVNDAIPYNGALLHESGVLTAFNSDDAEMGRRLNQEAAKAVKYGGVSEEEAWKFVTLNPAKMLHLDHKLGSVKKGKDADLVVWSGHPMSIYSKAEKTMIDGLIYFDFDRNKELAQRNLKEKERLSAKMLKEISGGVKAQKIKKTNKKLYDCDDVEYED